MIPFPATASPLEIAWTLDVFGGLCLSCVLVRFWSRKRDYLLARDLNGERMDTVLSHLMRKLFYLGAHLLFLIAGILFILLPPRPSVDAASRYVGPFVVAMLFFVALGMQADMVRARIRYRHFEDVGHRDELRP